MSVGRGRSQSSKRGKVPLLSHNALSYLLPSLSISVSSPLPIFLSYSAFFLPIPSSSRGPGLRSLSQEACSPAGPGRARPPNGFWTSRGRYSFHTGIKLLLPRANTSLIIVRTWSMYSAGYLIRSRYTSTFGVRYTEAKIVVLVTRNTQRTYLLIGRSQRKNDARQDLRKHAAHDPR